VEIEENSQLLAEGAYIKQIPLVIEGNIKVRKSDDNGKELLLYHILPGESCILSITSSLNDKKSNAEAIAYLPTKVILVSSSVLRRWMDIYPGWRKYVMQLYYERLDQLLSLVDKIAFQHLDIRLLETLKQKSIHHGKDLTITHQQLADELGTAREVVTRLLKQLEIAGKIRTLRGKIEIIQPL
jgi:CRP/FNR family transcriptional regulator